MASIILTSMKEESLLAMKCNAEERPLQKIGSPLAQAKYWDMNGFDEDEDHLLCLTPQPVVWTFIFPLVCWGKIFRIVGMEMLLNDFRI